MRAFQKDKVPATRGTYKFIDTAMPIDLEIGSGNGRHSIGYCKQNPERYLISIERTKNKFSKMKRRLDNHPQINNLEIIHEDAISYVAHIVPDNSLSKVFILYPNPYPKNPAARFPHMPFMSCLLNKLRTNGTLTMASNCKFYMDEAKEILPANYNLSLLCEEQWNIEKGVRTNFELKYLERGEVCTNLTFQKMPID